MSELEKVVKKERSERILTFDLLRGYFLCVILFNHLYYYPSGLDGLTGRGILYASTAEGFFVVSGIVLGIVRGRKLLHLPFLTGAKLLWKRAFQLYLTSIILTFLFTVVGQFFLANEGLKYGIFTQWNTWWELLWHTIALSYTYGWADFLRLYALFIFFAPFALWLLRKGWWYILLGASAAIWALFPFLPDDPVISQPFSWQLIFFAGFTIGFYWQTILSRWRSLALSTRRFIGWTTVSLFGITAIISASLVFGHELSEPAATTLTAFHRSIELWFDKDQLPLGRLVLGTIWFWGLFFLFRRFEGWIIKHFGWLLLTFGMNSLYVYTISAFVVFFMHLIVASGGTDSLLLNLALSLASLCVVYIATRTKFLMNIIPK